MEGASRGSQGRELQDEAYPEDLDIRGIKDDLQHLLIPANSR